MSSAHKKIAGLLAPYGLDVVQSKNGHYKIMRGEQQIDVLAGSPRDTNSLKFTIRRLAQAGMIPQELCRIKF